MSRKAFRGLAEISRRRHDALTAPQCRPGNTRSNAAPRTSDKPNFAHILFFFELLLENAGVIEAPGQDLTFRVALVTDKIVEKEASLMGRSSPSWL